MQAVAAALSAAIAQVQTRLQPVLAQYGAATNNFISDTYVANHIGLDLLFDMVAIDVTNGNLTITNKIVDSIIYTVVLNGNTLTGNLDTTKIPAAPSQVTDTVYIYPANASIAVGSTLAFKAVALGIANQGFSWSVVNTSIIASSTKGRSR